MPLKHESFDAPMMLSDVLLVEVHSGWCREEITLAPIDADLPVGAVLAVKSDGMCVPYRQTDGDSAAAAMLITSAGKSTAPQPGVAVMRGVVVATANLHFLPAVTGTQKQTALDQLKALGIVPQE